MVKMKTQMWILIAAVVVSGVGLLAPQSPLSVTGDNGDTVGPADDDAVASLSFKVEDAMADDLVYTASDYYVYDQDGLQVASGETSTSSFTKVSDLDEDSTYTIHVVDDDGTDSDEMYHTSKTVDTGESVSRFTMEANAQGSMTTTVREDVGTEDDGTISLNQGQTETITLEIEESSGDAMIKDPGMFVEVNDSQAIENVEVVDASSTDVPDRLSADDGYDLGFDSVSDYGTKQVDVRITRADGNSDSATVDLTVADGDQFQTGQDTWEFGYEDDSDADIRVGDSTSTVTVN